MISPVRFRSAEPVAAQVSARWLASVLVGASVLELTILRVGTRTAIHIPGLEEVAGPYRLVAAAGRLAFFVAIVVLAVLLPYLAHHLYQRGRARSAACLFTFVVIATLGGLRLVGNDVLAPAVTAIVALLAAVVLARQPRALRVVVGLFVVAFLASALRAILQSGFGGGLTGGSGHLSRGAELLAVLAAVSSGPLVRRALGLDWLPSGRLAWTGIGVGLLVTGAILANASTVHILMLWNFGLTGALPAGAYGLALASFVVAVASAVRSGHRPLALALTLMFLGGVGLMSTYQSGLVVAGLGLLDSARPGLITQAPPAMPSRPADPACRVLR